MPNILKRPMFRKGGSASYGTGITSGLEDERQNYQMGGFTLNPSMEGYQQGGTMDPRQITKQLTDVKELYDPDEPIGGAIDVKSIIEENQKKQQQPQQPDQYLASSGIMQAALEDIEPTTGEKIGRTLTGLAAAGRTDDPTKFKSIGQFLSEFGTTVAGLEEKDKEAVRKFKLEAALERIKGLNKDEKDQLLRYASEYAQIEQIPPEKRTPEQKSRMLFLKRYLEGVPRKGTDWQARELDLRDVLTKPRAQGGGYGYSQIQGANIASVQRAIEESGGKIKPANYGPKDGDYSKLPSGRYIDPDTATIILWDGKTKKQVWPSQ